MDRLVSHRTAALTVAVIALGIRLVHLSQPMRHDEAYTFLHYASQPLGVAITEYTYPNNHVFHSLLVWVTTRLFGSSPAAIRLPALLAGLAIVPATYAVARRLADRDASLLAGALAAVWPVLVLYSTNARGHSLLALAFLALLLLGERVIQSPGWLPLMAIAAVLALGTFTVPVMLYPGGAALLWIAAETWRRRGRGAFVALVPRLAACVAVAAVATALLYLPLLRHAGFAALARNRYVVALGIAELGRQLWRFVLDLAVELGLGFPIPALALLVAAAAWGALRPGPDRARRLVLAASAIGWCMLLLVVTRRPPPPRVWLFLVPLCCVFAAIGAADWVARLGRRRSRGGGALARTMAIVLALGMSAQLLLGRAVFRTLDTGTLESAPRIAEHLLARLRPGDRIVAFSPCDAPLEYYLWRRSGRRLSAINPPGEPGRVFLIVNPRHLQTVANVQARVRDVPWNELRPAGPPLDFAPAFVQLFERTSAELRTGR